MPIGRIQFRRRDTKKKGSSRYEFGPFSDAESLRTFERDEVLWSETHSQMLSEHDSTIGLARGQSQPEGRV